MSVTIDIIDQDVFRAFVTFFQTFIPSNVEIIQQQDNRVPMPKGAFIAMNNNGMDRLSFNVDSYDALTQGKFMLSSFTYEVQLDFYGPISQSWAAETVTLFRDEYATEIFPANIQPLYADDPIQIPLVSGESQYIQRWRLAARVQYKPTVSTIQQSTLAVDIGLAPIDQTFKP